MRLIVVADADEVDVTLAVDLATGQEEHIHAALTGAVEQFHAARGEEIVLAALKKRDIRQAVAARAGKQCPGGRDGRRIADGDMPHITDQAGDGGDEEFFYLSRHGRA